jgi:nucleotide-binding universal stress UspA family protein
MSASTAGPIVFAYDGSELAKLAIEKVGGLLGTGRDALALTVWQPFDVGFVLPSGLHFDTAHVAEVRKAAEETAADGASLAEAAGFRAQSLAIEGAPTWKQIVELADQRDASLIVLGSHGRTSLAEVLLGSVAGAVASHSRRSVLVVHRPPERSTSDLKPEGARHDND